MLFRKKKPVKKVEKHEFLHFTERIKSHFLRIKDMQMHTIDRMNSIHDSHSKLSDRFHSDSTTMQKWLHYFHNQHENHKKEILELKKAVITVNNRLNATSKIDEQYIRSIVDNYIQIPQKDKNELKRDVIEVLKDLRNRQQITKPVNNVSNVNIVNNDNDITRYNNDVTTVNNDVNKNFSRYNRNNANKQITHNESYNVNNVQFTKSETRILAKLFESTIPLAYNDVAKSTGHSPNTVKVYINALKKKGVRFDEIDAPNGCKLYAIPNKEKVRKLYNFA